jgi:hypothetical protein
MGVGPAERLRTHNVAENHVSGPDTRAPFPFRPSMPGFGFALGLSSSTREPQRQVDGFRRRGRGFDRVHDLTVPVNLPGVEADNRFTDL